MDRAVYDEYYHAERHHWWFTARMRILEGMVRKHIPGAGKGGLSILNVGVATGATTQMLEQFGKVTSVEWDLQTCEFLRKELKMEVIHGDVTKLPLGSGLYDLVCCFDVVEHVEDDGAAASELARMVRPGGCLFVTVPAFMFLWNEHDVANHHHRRYTKGSLRRLFKSKGLETLFLSYFNHLLFPPIAAVRLVTAPFRRKVTQEEARTDLRLQKADSLSSRMLHRIFLMERGVLLSRIPFPWGVSLLLLMRKPEK